MKTYYFVAMFEWAFILRYLQNRAKQDTGLGQAKVLAGCASVFCYIPLGNIVGILAPRLLLGEEVVGCLRHRGKHRIRLRRVRI